MKVGTRIEMKKELPVFDKPVGLEDRCDACLAELVINAQALDAARKSKYRIGPAGLCEEHFSEYVSVAY